MSLNLTDLDGVRDEMLAEIDQDIAGGVLYRSKRFTDGGWAAYPELLKAAAISGDASTLTAALAKAEYWRAQEQSTSSKGKVYFKKVPVNAHETFAESEFNRFYLRGLCRAAAGRGIPEIIVYRAKAVSVPRAESEALIGRSLDAPTLLADLRTHTGVDTALGLPPGPNSGLSGKFPT